MDRRTALATLLCASSAQGPATAASARAPKIAYDPSPDALFNPWMRPTLFEAGQRLSVLQLAVEAARLAYVRAEASATEDRRLRHALGLAGFETVTPFSDTRTGSQAYGAYRAGDSTALVAFRGTEPKALEDILGDLNVPPTPWKSTGRVHSGFAERALALFPLIDAWLNGVARNRRSLLLTGHSLGAALATLAATEFRDAQLITLGSPQVGDDEFVRSIDGQHSLRLVNCLDGVTFLPSPIDNPVYRHVPTRLYVSSAGVVEEAADAAFVFKDRVGAPLDYRLKFPLAKLPRALADHAPINYARAFF